MILKTELTDFKYIVTELEIVALALNTLHDLELCRFGIFLSGLWVVHTLELLFSLLKYFHAWKEKEASSVQAFIQLLILHKIESPFYLLPLSLEKSLQSVRFKGKSSISLKTNCSEKTPYAPLARNPGWEPHLSTPAAPVPPAVITSSLICVCPWAWLPLPANNTHTRAVELTSFAVIFITAGTTSGTSDPLINRGWMNKWVTNSFQVD